MGGGKSAPNMFLGQMLCYKLHLERRKNRKFGSHAGIRLQAQVDM